MKQTLFKWAVGACSFVAVASASALTVGSPVTIQEGAIPGAATNSVVVHQLGGFYDEIFTVTGANTFATEAIFRATGWDVPSQVGLAENLFGGAGYGLYAKFISSGTFAPSGSGFKFTGGAGYIELWADAKQNTVYNVAGMASGTSGSVGNLVLSSGAASTTDDILLGKASVQSSGDGNGTPGGLGTANGNFELTFSDWTLTNPAGMAYFVAPVPFYVKLDLNGNFQGFDPTSATNTLLLGNVANAFFFIPEPNALALVGLALLGAGIASRRKAK